MSSYRIELSLDGTTLRASLLDADHWCMEVSGDSVDLAPLINAARAEGMREAAGIVTEHYESLSEEHRLLLVNRSAAILSAIGGQK